MVGMAVLHRAIARGQSCDLVKISLWMRVLRNDCLIKGGDEQDEVEGNDD
jgi:hypothetical protein